MGLDDDADCVEHEWVLAEVHLTLGESGTGSVCRKCKVPAYDDLTPPATRPKL